MTQWSVGMEATGDVIMKHEQILELADNVTAYSGIASGINSPCYGVKLLVDADTREEAIEKAMGYFHEAAQNAGLPMWPVTTIEAASEYDFDVSDL